MIGTSRQRSLVCSAFIWTYKKTLRVDGAFARLSIVRLRQLWTVKL